MSERYKVLATRIRQELDALEKAAARAKRAGALALKSSPDQDLYLDAAALNLHDFYTGLERAFQQIAASLDESVPDGSNWHRELLRRMASECPQIRPAVISGKTLELLDEYLRFRHVVRNIYAFEFDPDRIGRLAEGLDLLLSHLSKELRAFALFLERLAEAEEQ